MWSSRTRELERARGALQMRSHTLRLRLGAEAQALERPLARVDMVRERLRWLRAHPQALVAIALVPLVPLILRPRKLLGWGLKAWGVWRLWRQVRAALPLR
jgi:hypothetical protein